MIDLLLILGYVLFAGALLAAIVLPVVRGISQVSRKLLAGLFLPVIIILVAGLIELSGEPGTVLAGTLIRSAVWLFVLALLALVGGETWRLFKK